MLNIFCYWNWQIDNLILQVLFPVPTQRELKASKQAIPHVTEGTGFSVVHIRNMIPNRENKRTHWIYNASVCLGLHAKSPQNLSY